MHPLKPGQSTQHLDDGSASNLFSFLRNKGGEKAGSHHLLMLLLEDGDAALDESSQALVPFPCSLPFV